MYNRKELALSRIGRLFELAEDAFKKNPARANRYVYLARKISTRLKVRIPSVYKRRFCKKCGNFLKPGVNCRIRTKTGMLISTCLNCKNISRFKLR